MVGEFGGIGWFEPGESFWASRCFTYLPAATPEDLVSLYINMTDKIIRDGTASASVYTQIADVETECDGFLNYNRDPKLSGHLIAQIWSANQDMIKRAIPSA